MEHTKIDSAVNGKNREAVLRLGFADFDVRTVTHDGVEIGYRVRGNGPAVVLIHGYPQSGYEWRHIAHELSSRFRVIVPDYRGAAGSSKPEVGYDKRTMAADIHAVALDAGAEIAHVVGHDIGMMVAYAYARSFASETATLTLLDGVIPGTPMFANFIASGRAWHFGFHNEVDLAAQLLAGRESIYFDWIFDGNTVVKEAIGAEERAFYVREAQAPGALKAGLRTYAAVAEDGVENEKVLKRDGKLSMPVLALGGAFSLGPMMGAITAEIASNFAVDIIEGAGHFIAEEKPAAILRALTDFYEKNENAVNVTM